MREKNMNDQDIMMNNLEAREMKREEELYLQAQYDKEMVNYSEPVSFDMWKAAKAVVARYDLKKLTV